MKFLTKPDATQEQIVPHLRDTESLLAAAATAVSGRQQSAEITVLPDLGLPHNVRRMHGGFFTGAHYAWTTDVPLVPVDATVNVCGVSVYKTSMNPSSAREFQDRIQTARKNLSETTPFGWNWNNGNHFVILAEVREPGGVLDVGRYLILHASAAEFKSQYNGLYPTAGNWFSSDIQVINGSDNRYLRYISGAKAEQFFRTAEMLEAYHRERQHICADLIAAGETLVEISSVPHYGMPDQNSVAIGCQWMSPENPNYILLTRPGAPLFAVSATENGPNLVETMRGTRILTPHGLGVRASVPQPIAYGSDYLRIGHRQFSLDATIADSPVAEIRPFEGGSTIERALEQCPGNVFATLHQLYSHHRNQGVTK
jgi:hypothetical protein